MPLDAYLIFLLNVEVKKFVYCNFKRKGKIKILSVNNFNFFTLEDNLVI
jgi:hypothetical protein